MQQLLAIPLAIITMIWIGFIAPKKKNCMLRIRKNK